MKTTSRYRLAIVSCALLLVFAGFAYFAGQTFHKQVPLTTEKELKVTLDAGFSDLTLSRGSGANVLDATIENESDLDPERFVEYVPRGSVGYLTINTSGDASSGSKKHSVEFKGFHSNSCDLRFTDALPISFELGLGLGKGNLDRTGLNVKDLRLSAGASSVRLRFDKPNKSVIENLTIESGLSKFEGEGLCNANFNRLKFEGGVGSYSLDFGGELRKEVDVQVEVGLGTLTIDIPPGTGAKVIYEKNIFAHVDLDRDFSEEQDNSYYSANYRTAPGRMNIRIDAGLGSVRIHHSR